MSRRKHDHYTTESVTIPLTRELLARVPEISGTVLECCAGEGIMAGVLRECPRITKVHTNDIDEQWSTHFHDDACDRNAPFWFWTHEWCVTNPPFSIAYPIIKNALEYAQVGVAFLLLQTWDEPNYERGAWLEEFSDQQTHRMTVHPRPNFRAGERNPKTGKPYNGYSCSFTWYVWQKNWSWDALGISRPFQYIRNWKENV